MIESIVFPVDVTERLAKRAASIPGSRLVILPRSTKDGTGVAFWASIRTPETVNAKSGECDDPEEDSSHLCPGPLCPEPGP